MNMCGCKGKTFEEVKKRVVCFEDYESGQEPIPAPEEALAEIKAGKCLPDLFSNVKAFLMSAVTELDIVNDLITGGIDKALSAEMGVALREMIEQVDGRVALLENEMSDVQRGINIINNEINIVQTDMTAIKADVDSEVLTRQAGDQSLEEKITGLRADLSDYIKKGLSKPAMDASSSFDISNKLALIVWQKLDYPREVVLLWLPLLKKAVMISNTSGSAVNCTYNEVTGKVTVFCKNMTYAYYNVIYLTK